MAEADSDAIITARVSGEEERRKYGIPEGTVVLVISREGQEDEIHFCAVRMSSGKSKGMLLQVRVGTR